MTDFSNASGTGMFDPFIVSTFQNVYAHKFEFLGILHFAF